MCQNRVRIAMQTEGQFITLCQHQIVHVHWDSVTVSSSLDDFRLLVEIVMQQLERPLDVDAAVHIRVNNTILGWALPDFCRFADMVLSGLDGLDRGMLQLAQKSRMPRRPSGVRFSQN